jgi:hypothetical protein
VKPGEQYQFKITNAKFEPSVRLQNGAALLHHQRAGNGQHSMEFTYTVPNAVPMLTIYVSGEAHGLGDYTLEVSRLTRK